MNPPSHQPSPNAPAHGDAATTLSAANNDRANRSAQSNLKAIAAAESAEENLMSPAPSNDAAIKAALPADTDRSRPAPSAQPKTSSMPKPKANSPASGKSSAPLVAGH